MSNKILQSAKIIEKLKRFLDFKTDTQLSVFLGVSQSTISTWKKRNSLDLDMIIAKCENINLGWLLSEDENPPETQIAQPKMPIETTISTIPPNRVEVLPVRVYNVQASAGDNGYIAADHAEGEYYLDVAEVEMYTRTLPNKPFAYRVSGNSMEPDFFSGDLVVVEPFSGSLTDGVYVFRIDDGVLLKQIQRLPNSRIRIISLNLTYVPFEVMLDGSVDIQFLGRVCGKYRRY